MADGEFRLKGKVVWKYVITLKTGLHIGGASSIYEIGAPDSPVIKDPRTDEPYIPGSSVKGKLRSLLERRYVDWAEVIRIRSMYKEKEKELKEQLEKIGFTYNNRIVQLGDCGKYRENHQKDVSFICKLFGVASNVESAEPTRVIITDAALVGGFTGTEIKGENALDRVTSAANPRFIERVPPGARFEGYIIFNVYTDDDAELVKYLKEALELLARDYLGGHGSRGYGRVAVEIKDPESYPEDFLNDDKMNDAFGELARSYGLDEQKG